MRVPQVRTKHLVPCLAGPVVLRPSSEKAAGEGDRGGLSQDGARSQGAREAAGFPTLTLGCSHKPAGSPLGAPRAGTATLVPSLPNTAARGSLRNSARDRAPPSSLGVGPASRPSRGPGAATNGLVTKGLRCHSPSDTCFRTNEAEQVPFVHSGSVADTRTPLPPGDTHLHDGDVEAVHRPHCPSVLQLLRRLRVQLHLLLLLRGRDAEEVVRELADVYLRGRGQVRAQGVGHGV